MKKIIQFGEGGFLRTFVDVYFDTLNKEDKNEYEINIVKPIIFGNLNKFKLQDNKYHVILRGLKNSNLTEDVFSIDSIKNVIDPFNNIDDFYRLALDKDIVLLISNTTEAGICFNQNDKYDDFENITYPAKLTKWLYKRFEAGLNGIYLLPVELIENNADELYKCVDKYITLWNLGNKFRNWNNTHNYYCNTLVDRIVSGYPKDENTKNHLINLIGKNDELMSIGEPFGLWVIQDKGNIKDYIKEGHHNIDVIITSDISYYKKRKVRVLNGSHTNLVPLSLWYGKETVYDVMIDKALSKFVDDTLMNDIVPFVSDDIDETTKFANDVKERFLNPFLNHQLTSIALNSISKWKARNLCSFVDFYNKNSAIPKYLTIGFAYLINMYMSIEKKDDEYICHLPSRDISIKDDLHYLEYFLQGKTVHEFLSDTNIWDCDLTKFIGLEETINAHLNDIKQGKRII